MKKGLLSALCAFGILSLAGCDLSSSDDGNCIRKNVASATTSVTGETTGAVNDTIALSVTYTVDNSCGAFQTFQQENTGAFEKEIGVLAQYEGCDCEETETTLTQTYQFKPTTPGTYLFRFRKGTTPEETYEEFTVTVE